MKAPCTESKPCCQKGKAIVLIVLLTIFSVFISLLITGLCTMRLARKAHLKDVLRKLFPGYDWEFTGQYVHLNHLKFRIYCPEGFNLEYPNAEEILRAELLAGTPQLAKLKLEIEFLPIAEFPLFTQPDES